MARQDDVVALAQLALGLRPLSEASGIVAAIASRSEGNLKVRLQRLLERQPRPQAIGSPPVPDVLAVRSPVALDTLCLGAEARKVTDRFLSDYAFADTFGAHGVPVVHKLLFTGPPGNGKTSLAAAIAGSLGLPLFAFDLSRAFGEFLGETAKNLGAAFRFAVSQPCVLLLDEADALLAERSARDDNSGETARAVAALLVQIVISE